MSRSTRRWSHKLTRRSVIEDAEARGLLHPHTGSVLFEGTVGSTGISLATVGRAKWVLRVVRHGPSLTGYRGYEACIIMPDDVAIEKVQVLEKLGAKVERVRPGESNERLESVSSSSPTASYVDEKQVGADSQV